MHYQIFWSILVLFVDLFFVCFLSHELWIFIILMKKMYFLYEEFLFMYELQYLFYLKSAVSFSKVIIVQINSHNCAQ